MLVMSKENDVFWKTVSSRLGLRTEISARYCLETTRTGVPHLFCFHENVELCEKILPHFLWKIIPHFLWKNLPHFLWKNLPHFYLLTSLIILTLLILLIL